MRIEALRIDGYGIHANLEISDLPPGLTIVTGPNETGKTTLLDFIRGVLFDFPNRAKRTLPFHEPLRGGRHGGAMTLVDGVGRRWFLERHVGDKEPRLTSQDGESVSPAMLSTLLGGANDALFRNVFAFGLGELSSFSSLNSEEVRERVFSAGVLGAGRSANQAIKQIEAQRAKLVKQRSAASLATDLQRQLGELDDNLRAARRSAEHYPALLLEQQVAEDRLDDARVEEEAVRARAAELQHLVTLEPIWRDRSEAAATLASIGPMLELHEAVIRVADPVRRLVRGESGHAERVAKLLEYSSTIEAASVELESVRRRLGGIPIVEVPLAIAGLVVELREQLPNSLAELRGADDALRAAQALDAAAALALREAEEVAAPRDAAAITADLEVAQQLDTAIHRADELDKARREAALRLEVEQLRAGQQRGATDRASVTLLYGVGTALAIIGAIVLAANPGHAFVGRILGAAAILAAAVVAAVAIHLGARLKVTTSPTTTHEDSERASARETITRLAAVLGLNDDSSIEFPALFARLREEREARRRLDELGRERSRTTTAVAEAAKRRDQARAAISLIDKRAADAARSLGLDDALGLEGLRRALDELEHGRVLEERIDKNTRAIALHRDDIEAFEGGLVSVEAALELDSLGDPAFRVQRIAELLESASLAEREREQLRERVERADRQLEGAFGGDERGRRLMTELALGAGEMWRSEQQRLIGALAEASEQVDHELGAVRDITRAAEALRASAEVAELATERESTGAALESVLEQWLALGAAKSFLEECLARYRRDRQPKVVSYAGSLFAEITGGRYTRLSVTGDEGRDASIAALDRSGQLVDATNLSTGTKEQLYLALRLAFAATFAEEAATLPIVVDDVTANADDDREGTVATILAKVAECHQVITFTCHPSLVETLRTKAPGAKVIELG